MVGVEASKSSPPEQKEAFSKAIFIVQVTIEVQRQVLIRCQEVKPEVNDLDQRLGNFGLVGLIFIIGGIKVDENVNDALLS